MIRERQVVRIGARSSELARWQADFVAELLRANYPDLLVEIVLFSTRGDQSLNTPLPLIGGKGLFTAELESALQAGTLDLAVHSLKDLPTQDPAELTVGAYPLRAAVNDALVSRAGLRLEDLPPGAVIGTSSRRRAAQLLAHRPQLTLMDIRGNVPTRLHKVMDAAGPYDATVLAEVGLDRLQQSDAITQVLPLEVMLPAPGQGALGIQCRRHHDWLHLLEPLNHPPTQLAVTAERAFLTGLGGGCAVPIAAYGYLDAGRLLLQGRVYSPDGQVRVQVSAVQMLTVTGAQAVASAHQLGLDLAQAALERGAGDILEALP